MITASIVLYNTSNWLLKRVITSYAPSINRRLFLIDNSEIRNKSIEGVCNKWIKYIFNGKNVGYGAGHNIGIKKAIEIKSDYHIVLNPDLLFTPDVIDKLMEYADQHLDVVYMLPKVLFPDGHIQYLCKLLPTPIDLIFRRFLPETKFTKKINERYILASFGYDKIINPPCLSGCFMFMRTKTLADNNLFFDERFFMYCEDFDLIRRLHRVGKTIFYPEVSIFHDHAHGSYRNKRMMAMHMKSACKYFNKYGWFVDNERKVMNTKVLHEIEY